MWTYNSIRIYVQEKSGRVEQLIARLNPSGGGTIKHRFGDDDEILTLEAKVLTDSDLDSLKALILTGTAYELVAPEGSLGNWVLKSVSHRRETSTWHVFFDRPGLPTNTPLYTVTMELYLP